MAKIIQKPLVCREAHCGVMCSPIDAEDMFTFYGSNPNKCPNYERRDDLYRNNELDGEYLIEKMNKKDKEVILRYINLLGEEILRDKKIAEDLDEKITMEVQKIPQRDIYKALKLMGKRIKIAKAILKNHENIDKMIDYVAAEGYEIIWEGYKVVDIIKKGDEENEK